MIGMPCNWVQFAGSRGKSHIRKPVEARSPNPQGVEEQLAASVRSHDALVLLDLLLVATLFAVRILQLKHHPLPFGADKNGIRHDTLRQLSHTSDDSCHPSSRAARPGSCAHERTSGVCASFGRVSPSRSRASTSGRSPARA